MPVDAKPNSWEQVSAVYEQRILAYHDERGADRESAQVTANVENNTASVPARGDHLIRMLRELGDEKLADKDVLDIGSGFGALATYLAWRGRPRRLVATDVEDRLLVVAEDCTRKTGLADFISFVRADMRDLSPLGDDRFNVVIANGVIFYVPNRRDLRRTLEEFHRVLRPGGHLLFYHSNKWRWTDPFTSDPLVHLLPPPLELAVSRKTGWRSSRGRVRLISAAELKRQLRRAGFRGIKIIGFGKRRRHTEPIVRLFGQRSVVYARRAV